VFVPLFYVAWCTTLYFYQGRLIFPADLAPPATGKPASRGAVKLSKPVDDKSEVYAWFLPPPVDPGGRARPLVVFFHGNAEVIDHQEDTVRGYHRLGCSVALIEYRGYGQCGGRPSQAGIRSDSIDFYDQLARRNDVDPERIVFHGRSLGGGIAADVARQRRPAALILQSTFTSVADMARGYLVPSFLARHPFRTDRALDTLNLPVLIFHGKRDKIIPVDHGRRLRDRAANAAYVEYDCGHNDFPGFGNDAEYWDQIASFLRTTRIIDATGP
jgi:fermentation-respiration switch protein FrsA (DUF1100 family)